MLVSLALSPKLGMEDMFDMAWLEEGTAIRTNCAVLDCIGTVTIRVFTDGRYPHDKAFCRKHIGQARELVRELSNGIR